MPNHSKSFPRSRIVRWTDDEWARIASQLYPQVRAVQFEPSDLRGVKARNIFLAQHVLPPDRHRKLVSIAQGVDGIRARLRTILQSLLRTDQDEIVQASSPGAEYEASGEEKASNPHERIEENTGALQPQTSANEVTETHVSQPKPEFQETVTSVADSVRVRHSAPRIGEVGEPIAEQRISSNATPGDQPGCSWQEAPAAPYRPAPVPATTSLTELARPFVAMVCEEFASALARVIATQGPRQALQVETEKAPGLGVASKQAALNECRGVEQQTGAGSDETIMRKRSSADNQSQPAPMAEVFDDGHPDMDEVDVQPLFDPKLSPSANGDFKPNIGVVATHANDLQELRHLYPQLNLTIVQAEAVSDVRRFGHCQRIIALRDEISPDTDELLGRLLRHRYVRLGGGIHGIREQLNAWLDAPESITFAPRRVMPSYGKELDGELTKKTPSRYPRILGRC